MRLSFDEKAKRWRIDIDLASEGKGARDAGVTRLFPTSSNPVCFNTATSSGSPITRSFLIFRFRSRTGTPATAKA
jgi:hypothetical protein